MKTDRSEIPFQIMALTIPAAEAAVGTNWLPTLVLALASILLCSWMSVQEDPNWYWLRLSRIALLTLLLSWGLGWTHCCWPGRGAEYVVPGFLLVLAIYAVWKGCGTRTCAVLRYGVYLILFALGIMGLFQIKWETLRPRAQLPDMKLAVVLLLPLLGRKNGKWKYSPIGVVAVAVSILTVGSVTLYDYSKALSLAGVAEHMESLAACAITAGYFGFLCYLLEGIKQEEEKGRTLLLTGTIAYGIYLTGMTIRPEAYVALVLLLWVLVPSIGAVKKKVKKKEKSA